MAQQLAIQLESVLGEAVQKQNLPGLVVGVTRNNEPVYTGAFGVLDQSTQRPVEPDSLFHMASISKSFVSTAVMQLTERGLVHLDDPIVKHLQYFRLDDDRSEQLTLRQVLSHTSGIPHVHDTASYNWHQPEYDDGALERYVHGLHTTSLISSPSEKYSYSDIGYDILGDVIAKVSGVSFETYMTEHLLSPLNMNASTFHSPQQSDPRLVASPHVLNADGKPEVSSVYPYNRAHAPSSTLRSNILEMNRWAMAHLRRGELYGHQILRPESYEVMWKPVAPVGLNVSMGLGWFLRTFRSGTEIYLSGTDHGFTTHLSLYPDSQLSIVVMTNADWGKPWRIAADAARVIRGD